MSLPASDRARDSVVHLSGCLDNNETVSTFTMKAVMHGNREAEKTLAPTVSNEYLDAVYACARKELNPA